MTDNEKGPRYVAVLSNRGALVSHVAERQPDGTYLGVATVDGGVAKAKELADALNDRDDLRRLQQ